MSLQTYRPACSTSRRQVALTCLLAAMALAPSVQAATFYWDATSPASTAGFGNAAGTWAQNSTTGAGRWTTNSGGTAAGSATQPTANTDVFNFGTAANGLGTGTITVNGAVAMGNTTYGAASGNITLSGATGTINYAAAVTITTNNTTNTISTVIGGAGTSLTKAGTGTLVFTGSNTYAGNTIINNGTLLVNNTIGSGTGTNSVTVSSGGTFGGTGSVAGATTVNGTLAAGNNGIGTLNLASLSFGSGSTLAWQMNYEGATRGTHYDAVNLTGDLTGGGAIFRVVLPSSTDFSDAFWQSSRSWDDIFGSKSFDLIFGTFAYSNSVGTISAPDAITQGTFSLDGTSLVWTAAIPEPSAFAALAGLGALGLAGLSRRRRA